MRKIFIITLLLLSIVFLLPEPSSNIVTAARLQQSQTILTLGESGAWDAGDIRDPYVVMVDDTYYLFYGGRSDNEEYISAIGYAMSTDGIIWEKAPNNPIFEADGTGFDAVEVAAPVVHYQDGQWALYYAAIPEGEARTMAIGRATTSNLNGEWQRDESPLIRVGDDNVWDSLSIAVASVIQTETDFYLFYSGFSSQGEIGVGVATSPDASTWQKYNNPETNTSAFELSDPILQGDRSDWDAIIWAPYIYVIDGQWYMVYHGDRFNRGALEDVGLGYATSKDGITWERDDNNPFLTLDDGIHFPHTPFAIMIEDDLYIYYAAVEENGRQGQIELVINPF